MKQYTFFVVRRYHLKPLIKALNYCDIFILSFLHCILKGTAPTRTSDDSLFNMDVDASINEEDLCGETEALLDPPLPQASLSEACGDTQKIHPTTLPCPICLKPFKVNEKVIPAPTLWGHINYHISLNMFPPKEFVTTNHRLMCSTQGCHWTYHARFKRQGCQRPTPNQTNAVEHWSPPL